MYFPLFGTEEWAEKIRSQSQAIYSEVPLLFIAYNMTHFHSDVK